MSCSGGNDSDTSTCSHEPPTPNIVRVAADGSLGALQGRLEELALGREG